MKRTTIDFGIDLGTTNSAIAVLNGATPEIIKNNDHHDITPSAVSIDKKGSLLLGQRARNRIVEYPDDVCLEFKRQMGTDHVYQFKASGQNRKPEELSAEILKSLRADVQQRTGEIVEACVITVPAAFELHQCDATRKAAQLAGLSESPLLMEPTAASLAYGFQRESPKAYWLVYDFGGGTFDAALMKAEEGTINMVNYGGDNFLGGSDMDWAIVEQILVPRLLREFDLKDFTRGNKQWRRAFANLKRLAEIAKIDLSPKHIEHATLEGKLNGANGEEIEFGCELSRGELLRVAEPLIIRSADICKRVLKERNLGKDAVEKVILVGGPTLAHYFREILASSLGIPLDFSVDPLTVVARGAAVFAGTQRFTGRAAAPVAAGDYSIDLSHEPVGIDSAPMAGGRVSCPSTQDFTGFTLELVNTSTQWRSGKISLSTDGVFIVDLHAERGERNTFAIELFDPSGRKQKTTPDTLTYTIGAVVGEQPLINSMGIALGNNECARLFDKGTGLPITATGDFRTIHAIRQGRTEDICRIPVVEGENERADRNRLNGTLEIRGNMIRRDLPANSNVEVTLKMDKSRIVTVTAHVPFLDEYFSEVITMQHQKPDPDTLERDYQAEMKRFRELKAKAANAEDESAERLVQIAEGSPLMQEVKELGPAAKGDPDAAAKREKRLWELKHKLDEIEDALKWPELVAEFRKELDDLNAVVNRNGSPAQHGKAAQLASEAKGFIAERKMEPLRKKLAEVLRLYWEIVFAQPGFWVNQFQQMEKEQASMTDQTRAARLLDQGRDFLAKNNVEGLQNVVRILWDLLPREIVAAAKSSYQPGLVR